MRNFVYKRTKLLCMKVEQEEISKMQKDSAIGSMRKCLFWWFFLRGRGSFILLVVLEEM